MITDDDPLAGYFVEKEGPGAVDVAGSAGEGPSAYEEVIIGSEALHADDFGSEVAHVGGIGVGLQVTPEGGVIAVGGAVLAYEDEAIILPIAVHIAGDVALVPFGDLVGEEGADGGAVGGVLGMGEGLGGGG